MLLFFQNFHLGFGVVPPVWTLSVEVGFYVVLPFVAAWYFRHPLGGLAASAAIVLSWTALAHHSEPVASFFGGASELRRAFPDRHLLRQPVPELDAGTRLRDDRSVGLRAAA